MHRCKKSSIFALESMKKTIVFDLGGVIINLNVPRCVENFKRLMSEESIRTVLGIDDEGEGVVAVSAATKQLMHDYEYGNISSEAFVQTLRECCYEGVTEVQVKEAWMSMLADLPQAHLEYIRSLREQGYQTVLLSNSNELHWQPIWENYRLGEYFDYVFASQQLHMAKPNREIFEYVMKVVQMDPANTIYVDDLEKNRAAGERYAGWRTVSSMEELQLEILHFRF